MGGHVTTNFAQVCQALGRICAEGRDDMNSDDTDMFGIMTTSVLGTVI